MTLSLDSMEEDAYSREPNIDEISISYSRKKCKKQKMPIKYKSVSFTMKENKKAVVLPGKHICGNKMLYCVECCRSFCPECDFCLPKNVTQCCQDAIDSYLKDNEQKNIKRENIKKEMSRRTKSMHTKYKVSISEISNDNAL